MTVNIIFAFADQPEDIEEIVENLVVDYMKRTSF